MSVNPLAKIPAILSGVYSAPYPPMRTHLRGLQGRYAAGCEPVLSYYLLVLLRVLLYSTVLSTSVRLLLSTRISHVSV
jgi:hypothetical protein